RQQVEDRERQLVAGDAVDRADEREHDRAPQHQLPRRHPAEKAVDLVNQSGVPPTAAPPGEGDRCKRRQAPADYRPDRRLFQSVTLRIVTASTGTSWCPPRVSVGTPAMASTTSMPSVTRPKTA